MIHHQTPTVTFLLPCFIPPITSTKLIVSYLISKEADAVVAIKLPGWIPR